MHNNTTNNNDWNNFFIKAAEENIIVAKYTLETFPDHIDKATVTKVFAQHAYKQIEFAKYILETFPDHIDEATVTKVYRISTLVNPNFAKSILQIAPDKVNNDIGIGFKDIFEIGFLYKKNISSSLLTNIAETVSHSFEEAYEYFASDAQKADNIANLIIEQLNEQKSESAAEIYNDNNKLLLQHKKDSLQEISSELIEKHKVPYTLGLEMQQDLAENGMKLKEESAKTIMLKLQQLP
jgi:hypothetical protein